MKDSIYTLTIGTETMGEFPTRSEACTVVRELGISTGKPVDFKITETPFCRYCDEVREYEFMSACESCRFKKSEAVKASRKIIRAFKKAGDPIVKVWDGEEYITGNERDLLETVHSVDYSSLYSESGGFVCVVAGNESEADCIYDWSMSIDGIMRTVNLKEERED